MSQSNLDLTTEKKTGPVECLGQPFESDDARRAHYTELLREKLKAPEFRKIEGFPIGEDEDILNLSDPPYYTACPNPWIGDFIAHYGKPYDPKVKYHREPFAADVSEGKNHPIYNAHTYHTKVPHRAIMRYILHYTEPGDVVFDGFCGTGMTGVAAQLCGDEKEVRELGYRVDADGTIYNDEGKAFSKIGARRALLNDLSPLATHIASSYAKLGEDIKRLPELIDLLENIERDVSFIYESDGSHVLNGIWSDVFTCPECGHEIVFWEESVKDDKIQESFPCANCGITLGKAASKKTHAVKLERAHETTFDAVLGKTVKLPKFILVEETIKDGKKRVRVPASGARAATLSKQAGQVLAEVVPLKFERGRQTNKLINGSEIEYSHHMYTPRALAVYSYLWSFDCGDVALNRLLKFALTSINNYISRKQGYFGGGGGVAGTLFTPSIHLERNIFDVLRRKLKKLSTQPYDRVSFVSCQSSATGIVGLAESLDYIFVDPPFGENFQYAELNSFPESWLRVQSKTSDDCVMNYVHEKDLDFYGKLMRGSFDQFYKALKPGRWITVEFSNTQASVWNSIQAAMAEVGFVIANVSALDKQQGSFNAVTNTTSVKQDLVISAYKPNGGLEQRFSKHGDSIEGVWDFLQTHMKNLPVVKPKGGSLEFIAERDPRILYDRMVAFYVGHNTPVPLSSGEFQSALNEKFPERDGMVFLPEQVAEYDKKAAQMQNVGQLAIFVEDEKSAINWLRQFLKERPSIASDVTSEFMQQLSASWKKFETRPELSVLLDQNFIKYDGTGEVPGQIHGYLSTNYKDLRNKDKDDPALKAKAKDRWYVPDPKKAVDVEAVRNKRLLAEFWDYAEQAGINKKKPGDPNQGSLGIQEPAKKKAKVKKLKEVRTEAIRLGFMECNRNKDAATILAIAEILPKNVIEEDEQLQMIYDMAEMRAG